MWKPRSSNSKASPSSARVLSAINTDPGAAKAWMRAASYPATAEHEKQHDGFIKDILALSDQHEKKNGQGIEPARVAGWLEKWLKNHVMNTDTE